MKKLKKRQQQEIVVSGFTINTSDCSEELELAEAEAEAAEDKRSLTEAYSLFPNSREQEQADEMSLVEETSVRKVGGGGALSTSIFQVLFKLKQSIGQ